MKNLCTKLAILAMISLSPILHAATLESFIDAMAIKTSDNYTNNSWDNTAKIKGVKWKWPYYQSGAHPDPNAPMLSSMVGKAKFGKSKNPNVGVADIKISGPRNFINYISISIANESHQIEEFGKAKVTKIKTNCDDDSASNTIGFYKFEKAGYKPLYISSFESSGAAGIESGGSVDFNIANNIETVLTGFNADPPCKAL